MQEQLKATVQVAKETFEAQQDVLQKAIKSDLCSRSLIDPSALVFFTADMTLTLILALTLTLTSTSN